LVAGAVDLEVVAQVEAEVVTSQGDSVGDALAERMLGALIVSFGLAYRSAAFEVVATDDAAEDIERTVVAPVVLVEVGLAYHEGCKLTDLARKHNHYERLEAVTLGHDVVVLDLSLCGGRYFWMMGVNHSAAEECAGDGEKVGRWASVGMQRALDL